jgi:hypothetical protein
MPGSEEDRKHRFWKVDPAMYSRGSARSRASSFKDPLQSLAKPVLISLFFSYPLIVVFIGILYGGILYWASLTGSFALLGLFLWKTGYAKNFEAWNPKLGKQLLALVVAFAIVVGFYLGLFNARLWLVPISLGLGIGALIILVRRN